ncbi:MAG: phosphomannomutase [Gammaproteobacteria bacterium]|nr:phosphomannomutase [Gammaproteobacteria bacterium]
MNDKFVTVAIADLMAQSGVAFGTSGARGLADAMSDRVCYLYTVGFLQYLEKLDVIRPGDPVALAGDFRSSTPRIMAATAAAVSDLGYQPINCGNVPTPALAAYAIDRQAASLMVTGSHIPDDRNGIKFNKPDGEVLKADEAGIREQQVSVARRLFDDQGGFVDPVELPAVDNAALRHYIARYLDFLPAQCLAGTRVLVYEHSTVAAGALTEIFGGLGADVVRRGYSDAFVPVDTEAVRDADVALAREWAASEAFDLLVSADGDGDRPLVGDEHGNWLRGDVIGVLAARFLDADVVVTPVSSNSAVERCGWFPRVVRTRIGSPYVIEGMQMARDDGASRVVGYEANGGFLTLTPIDVDGCELPALPTRDAAIVALAVLLLARRQGLPVSQLATLLPARYTASDRLSDFPSAISAQRIADLADDPARVQLLLPQLGAVAATDVTDGLRITFDNQEVVHLRPSGNAPELRCYTEADSAQRARQLNAECIERLESWRQQ